MIDTAEQLALAGDALTHAWRTDLARKKRHTGLRRPRTLVLALVAVIVVSGGAAFAATTFFKTAQQEQTGMVEASTLFAGSNPVCVSVNGSDASFHCTLDRPPTGETFYSQDGTQLLNVFLGMKVGTVDATNHIDGGCVSDSTDGLSWQCYLGTAAVSHDIVSAEMLGKFSPGPAAG